MQRPRWSRSRCGTVHRSPPVSDREPPLEAPPYEPRRPALLATAAFTLWPALLSLPMLRGLWLADQWSDQYTGGFAWHTWSAAWFRRLGHLPLWDPEVFGGLPFAAGHGNAFYPTWLLRFVIPVTTAGNLSFFVHYILAALFTYLLLRRLRVSWTGSVIGGLAYELSGLIASYPSPGHDGKLFASAALPLVFLALVLALRDRRPEGYPLLAAAVALTLLGHFQLAYYLLIAAGLFALYLTVEEVPDARGGARLLSLGLALGAVLLGFGIAAIEIVPFFGYISFSPRAGGYYGFAGSTSYAIPWDHVPEFFLKNFVGSHETYWGSNPLKLHSEYLGLPVIALAVLGAGTRERRRLILWVGGIGLLFLLISLGAATPFYKLWWAVMPLVSKTRAPGMAFFVVAFVVAIFAAFGVDRALGKDGRRAMTPTLIIGAMVALLGITGAWGHVAAALAATAALFGLAQGRLTPRLGALTLALVVGTDLWLNARSFWRYSKPHEAEPLVTRVAATPPPFRVLDLGAYPGSVLAAFDVPQVLGYHGNELRYYDELLGGKNEWRNIGYLQLWDLLAVRYLIAPVGARKVDSIPGFRRILDSVPTLGGEQANLLERLAPAPYARVVPGAVKADSAAIIPTLLDPRMDYSRVVLFTPDQPVAPAPLKALPPPSPSHATVTLWQPGRMSVALDPAPPLPSYLLIAENWYPDWKATTDGRPAPCLRGDYSLITVPLAAGTKTVELSFRSQLYNRGRALTLGSLGLLAIAAAGSLAARRRQRA